MLSKGAVVIIKRGDEAMADSMANSLVAIEKINTDGNELENLKTQNFFLKRRVHKTTESMIEEARTMYGYNWTPPKWADHIVRGFALIIYGISLFVDRFMRIKE